MVDDKTACIAAAEADAIVSTDAGCLMNIGGRLHRQGREIGFYRTEAAEGEGLQANAANAWGPQPFKGNLFVSDMTSGLWVVRHARPRPVT